LRDLGAIDFIQKPFKAATLCQAVEAGRNDSRKILIADDNVDMQHLIVRILSSQDNKFEYVLASTGKDAWQAILDKKPDLILLDLALPEIDGWQLLKMKLEAPPAIRQIPLIIISAHELEDTPLVSKTLVITKNDGFLSDDLMKYVLGSLTLN
jgi:CheY-like chemotaxis protein